MRALVYHPSAARIAAARALGAVGAGGYLSRAGPLRCTTVPSPELRNGHWVLVRTRRAGICGSDLKQVFQDGSYDNPLLSLISFPHVMGHEAVGVVERVGPDVRRISVGDRVAIDPWLSCAAREVPLCNPCRSGQTTNCLNFVEADLGRGMHLGVSRAVPGAFAPLLGAHEQMCHVVPDGVSWDEAVLADPFGVALRTLLRSPPRAEETVLVFGCGTLGMILIHLIDRVFEGVRVVAVDRSELMAGAAESMGRCAFVTSRGSALIEEVERLTGTRSYRHNGGLPWLMEGVDRVYDTVGSGSSLAVGLRLVRAMGTIVVVGISAPRRFEWTPMIFKQISVVGANGCGLEGFEEREGHAFEHYFRLRSEGRVDLGRLVTHRFSLGDYRRAFLTARRKDLHASVKVVFAFGGANGEARRGSEGE